MILLRLLLVLVLCSPIVAHATHIAEEDFTTYTEVDNNTKIAITASTITATAIDTDDGSHVYFNKGADAKDSKYFTGLRARFTTTTTLSDNDTVEFCVFALANDVGACRSGWSADYFAVTWVATSAVANLRVRSNDGTSVGVSVDTSVNLSASTSYYVEVRWIGALVTVLIYSDSVYTTLVDTLTLTGHTPASTYRIVYPFAARDNMPAGSTSTMTVSNLTLYRFSFSSFTPMNRVITANFTDDFEAYPGSWTESEAGSSVVGQSTDFAKSGSNSLKISSVGTDRAFAWQDITAGTANRWSLSGEVYVTSVTDGSKCVFFGAREATTGFGAWAAVVRTGSRYHWAIIWYNGSYATVSAANDDELTLSTWYTVELAHEMDAGGSSHTLVLIVDGKVVAEVAPPTGLDGDYPTRLYVGDAIENPIDYSSVRYVDDLTFHNMRWASHDGIAHHTPSNTLVGSVRYATVHGYEADGKAIMVYSTDSGATWTQGTTIDEANPDDDRVMAGLIYSGTTIYAFNQYRDDNETSIWSTVVYQSTDSGVTFTEIASSELVGQHFIPSHESGGLIYGASWEDDADDSDNTVEYYSFDPSGPTWVDISTIATAGDFTNAWPNETGCYYRRSDADLVCLVRWAQHTGATQLFLSYVVSDDDGATWGSHTSLLSTWGIRGGRITSVLLFQSGAYVAGYTSTDGTIGVKIASFVMRFDPEDMTQLNETRWAFTSNSAEAGNGQLAYGGIDVNGDGHMYVMIDAGTAHFYDILLPEQFTSAHGGPMILRNYGWHN